MKTFLIILHLSGNPSSPVGVPLYGGATMSECNNYARSLIERIRRGAELSGRSYTALGFTCEGRAE